MKKGIKYLPIILLIAALTIRVLYYLGQPDFCTDHVSQIATAKNFIKGNGLSIGYTQDGDISKTYYKTHIQWPPAYSALLAGITTITGNYMISSFIIAVTTLLITLVFLIKTLLLFKGLIDKTSIYLLLSYVAISTSIYNNINTILTVPLPLIAGAVYYLLKYITDSKRSYLIISAVLSSLIFWFHYSYVLIGFTVPVVSALKYYYDRKSDEAKNVIITFIIGSFSILMLFGYNYINTGKINYMENPNVWEKGIFWNNLRLADPIFISSFIKTQYISSYITKSEIVLILLHLISLTTLILLIYSMFKYYKEERDPASKEIIKYTIFTFFIIFAFVTLLLIYFSLRYYEIPRPGWSHISDPRYLSFAYLTVIFLIFFTGYNKTTYNIPYAKMLRYVFLFLLIVNLALNVINIKMNIGKTFFNAEELIKEENSLTDLYYNIINLKKDDKNVVYIDNGSSMRSVRMAAYAGATICDSSYFMNKEIKTSRDVVCIFGVLRNADREIDKKLDKFGKENNYEHAGIMYNEPLYKVYLKPEDGK